MALVKQKQTVAKKASTLVVSPTPGDGDYTSIQAAINALPASGGTIFLREGTYSISSTITLPNKPIVILGAARYSTIIQCSSSLATLFSLPTTSGDYTLFKNLMISSETSGTGTAFSLPASTCRMRFESVNITGFNIIFKGSSGTYFSLRTSRCNFTVAPGRYFSDTCVGYLTAEDSSLVMSSNASSWQLVSASGCSFEGVAASQSVSFTWGSLCVGCYFGIPVNLTGTFVSGSRFDYGVTCQGDCTLVSCWIGNSSAGATWIIRLSGDRNVIEGCLFSTSISTAVQVESSYNVVVGNVNCKVVETGSPDSNFYSANRGFSGSTIIGAQSRVSHDRGVRTVSENTTLDETYDTVLVNASDGTRSVTLPSASSMKHRSLTVKKIDTSSNPVRVIAASGELIDNDSEISLDSSYQSITIVSDGSNWWAV